MAEFKLPTLGYEYDSLEPFIDKETMMFHHDKHHQTYCDKLNLAIKENPELQLKETEELLEDLNSISEKIRTAVKNFGGGLVNHNFFFSILKKNTQIKGKIAEAINKKFGSFDEFKKQFSEMANKLFGSGYTWLVLNKGELEIINASNQENPLSNGQIPLLTIDVWEHAYYLKYKNKRADYVEAFFSVINWDKVNEIFVDAIGD